MEQKEIEQKVLEYQMIDQRISHLREQIRTADEQILEMASVLRSIDDFSAYGPDTEMLVPLSNGIFAHAILKKEEKFLVNVGALVVVDKSPEETKQIISRQKEDLATVREEMSENLRRIISKAADIERILKDNL